MQRYTTYLRSTNHALDSTSLAALHYFDFILGRKVVLSNGNVKLLAAYEARYGFRL